MIVKDTAASMPASKTIGCLAFRDGVAMQAERSVPEECAVALVYDAATYAVLMATPADIEDLALGFSLTEGVIASPDQIASIDIVENSDGIEARMWLAASAGQAHLERRRTMLGPTGCGLCGVESLAVAISEPRPVSANTEWDAADIARATRMLREHQPLGDATRAVHAAGLYRDGGFVTVREDVGRHNALDKLAGAVARDDRRGDGLVVLTSRVSIDMIQKAAAIGVGCVAAISAPTAAAIEMADRAGMTLVAIARDDGFEVFTHPHRLRSIG